MNTRANFPEISEDASQAGRAALSRDEFTRRVLIVAGVIGTGVAALALIVQASGVVLLILAAILLAILLRGASNAMARRTRLSPGWSYWLVVLIAAGVLSAGSVIMWSTAADQFHRLSDDLPRSAEEARQLVKQYPWGDAVLRWVPSSDDLLAGGHAGPAARVARLFSTTFGVLGDCVVLIVLAVYLGGSPTTYTGGLVRLVPPARRARAEQVLEAIGVQLEWWLVGRLVAMGAVGLVVGSGLWLLGVSHAPVLALVAALLTAIPFLGPIIGAIPGVLIATSRGPAGALEVVGVYLLAQVVENYLITPLVQRRMAEMPPALTIAAVSLAGVLSGGLALVVATPVVVAARTAVRMLYIEDVLGDHPDLPDPVPPG